MKWIRTALMLAALALSAWGCDDKENPQAVVEARAAARQWLKLVDAGRYAESWDAAAKWFRREVPKEEWVRRLEELRRPMGAKTSRELDRARFQSSMRGAPLGEYVFIEYRSSFENNESARETVTPMKEDDGVWRVAGYYCK